MHRGHFFTLLVGFVAIVAVVATLGNPGPVASNSLPSDRHYPEGAGPNHINFSTLDADNNSVSRTPREHWDSYAIEYTEPPERPTVEGNYYVNSSTGEIISELWYGAKDYRDGNTYAFVQPAEKITNRARREQVEESAVYDDSTDSYYRYDPHYGRVAPHNIGRHPDVLASYTWEAVGTKTHHGVPVITYRATGQNPEVAGPQIVNGTLQLGAEDGVIYAFDVTIGEQSDYRYTYDVHPTEFPDHDWVDTARKVVAANNTSNSIPYRQQR